MIREWLATKEGKNDLIFGAAVGLLIVCLVDGIRLTQLRMEVTRVKSDRDRLASEAMGG